MEMFSNHINCFSLPKCHVYKGNSIIEFAFIPTLASIPHLFSCQSRDKMLQILLIFVLYPAMMVAIALAR